MISPIGWYASTSTKPTGAQRLDPEGWVDVLSLFGILLTDDNLRWEEVTCERAEQIGTKISPRTAV